MTDIQRRGLLGSLVGRLPCATFGELRLVDAALIALERIRESADGRTWERRIATGPGDRTWDYHLANVQADRIVARTPGEFACTACGLTMRGWTEFEEYQHDACGGLVRLRDDLRRDPVKVTLCKDSWATGDATESCPNPPIDSRCIECWKWAAVADGLHTALVFHAERLVEQDRERDAAHEADRDEVVPGRTLTADARRRLDEHRDRAVAEAIAEAPAGMYEVRIGLPGDDLASVESLDIEWDLSDVHAGSGT